MSYLAIVIFLVVIIAAAVAFYYLYYLPKHSTPSPPPSPGNPTPPPSPPAGPGAPPSPMTLTYAVSLVSYQWGLINTTLFAFAKGLYNLLNAFNIFNSKLNSTEMKIFKAAGYSGSWNSNPVEHAAPGNGYSSTYEIVLQQYTAANTFYSNLESIYSSLNTSISSYSSATTASTVTADIANLSKLVALFPSSTNLSQYITPVDLVSQINTTQWDALPIANDKTQFWSAWAWLCAYYFMMNNGVTFTTAALSGSSTGNWMYGTGNAADPKGGWNDIVTVVTKLLATSGAESGLTTYKSAYDTTTPYRDKAYYFNYLNSSANKTSSAVSALYAPVILQLNTASSPTTDGTNSTGSFPALAAALTSVKTALG